jgi:2-hydroxy-3-keto-5-methylthiopentenyl-1-phosphate phosphatase
MNFGVDFDNTIVSYDGLFEKAAAKTHLNCCGKEAIRDELRSRPAGEQMWQELQAEVYGRLIEEAHVMEGFEGFVNVCRAQDIPLQVVSHKTRFAAQNPLIDLRDAAKSWMRGQGFFDGLGFQESDVFFCETREEKVQKMKEIRCTHFVDDLPEVLGHQGFPAEVVRILYSVNQVPGHRFDFQGSWVEITRQFCTESYGSN